MSFNKVGTYTRLSSERDLLDNNSIIYIYGKDLYSINKQKNLISHFCKECGINPKKTYIDVECKNDFQSKNELNRLLLENDNTNIIIYSTNRLTRSISDLFDINDICKERNLGIFSVQNNEFIVDKKSILDVIQDIEKEFFLVQRYINVLLVEPNKLPQKMTIKNNVQEKRKLVDGSIEYTYLENYNDIAIIFNEEQKLLGLTPNRDIGYDVIKGNFLIVGDDPELGEDRSLTDSQIEKYSKIFDKNSIDNTNKKTDEILLKSITEDYYI